MIFFCIAAVGLGTNFKKKRKGVLGVFLVIVAFGGFIGLYPVFESAYNRFLMGGNIEQLLMTKEASAWLE